MRQQPDHASDPESDGGVEPGRLDRFAAAGPTTVGSATVLGAAAAAGSADAAPEFAPADSYPVTTEIRTRVVALTGFSTILLVAIGYLLPVPYALLKPGPVLNTLGSANGKPLISVSGHTTYPASGTLDLTTVRIAGGPGATVGLLPALFSWLSRGEATVPEEEYFAPGQTQQQTNDENQAEMVGSQESATAAALEALDIPVPQTLIVDSVDAKAPAAAVLRAKDVLVSVNGRPASDLDALRGLVHPLPPGSPVAIGVSRAGKPVELRTRTLNDGAGHSVIGIYLHPEFHFPFQVKIEIENVVGPSAGMMFALGIIDRLTPGDLTGGRRIAGTGAIEPDGTVQPIGGIRQKMVGARTAGVAYFLAPTADCDEVIGHVPSGMQVFAVGTLRQARTTVEAIAAGRTDGLPRCGSAG